MFFSDYCQAAVHLVAKLWRDDDRRKYGQRETRGFLKYFCPCKLLVLRMETEADRYEVMPAMSENVCLRDFVICFCLLIMQT